MPGGQERILRRRIKSVQSTKKITRAMELIAATRVVKAQQRAAAARALQPPDHAGDREPRRRRHRGRPSAAPSDATTCARWRSSSITSDRGLAGAYNSSIIRATERELNGHRDAAATTRLILHRPQGRELLPFPRLPHRSFLHRCERHADVTKTPARSPMLIAEKFISGEVDQVELIYTEFVSMGSQRVAVRRFLPLS